MIRFNILWLSTTTRWVAPACFYALWLLLALPSRGRAPETAVFMFPLNVLLSLWLTVLIGSLDDKPHRELLTASVGGPNRLHISRGLTSLTITGCLASVVLVLAAIADGSPGVRDLAIGASILLSGNLLGFSAGYLLHPPINEEVGLAVIAGPSYLMLIMVLPPVQWCLKNSNVEEAHNPGIGSIPLLATSVLIAGGAFTIAKHLAERRTM